MKKSKTKDIAIFTASVMASMVAGFVAGCIKEKMMNSCRCVIDNFEDLV